MDTDLVIRAQRGDKGAYALIAAAIADRFLAVARRILRDRDLAEDATPQADVGGVRVLIETDDFAATSAQRRVEMQGIVDSIVITP